MQHKLSKFPWRSRLALALYEHTHTTYCRSHTILRIVDQEKRDTCFWWTPFKKPHCTETLHQLKVKAHAPICLLKRWTEAELLFAFAVQDSETVQLWYRQTKFFHSCTSASSQSLQQMLQRRNRTQVEQIIMRVMRATKGQKCGSSVLMTSSSLCFLTSYKSTFKLGQRAMPTETSSLGCSSWVTLRIVLE